MKRLYLERSLVSGKRHAIKENGQNLLQFNPNENLVQNLNLIASTAIRRYIDTGIR